MSKSGVGFNGGLDIGYYFTKAIGVGAMVRYAGASISLPSHDQTVRVKAGGFQAGVGLRVRIPKSAPKKLPPKPPGPTPPVRK